MTVTTYAPIETSFDVIKQSHQLDGAAESLRNYYRTWAGSYDLDVAAERYEGPARLCDLLDEVLATPPSDAHVLDAGCGTGLVGLELVHRDYPAPDGCDLSTEMIEVAHETRAYRDLRSGVDLNWEISAELTDGYDAVVGERVHRRSCATDRAEPAGQSGPSRRDDRREHPGQLPASDELHRARAVAGARIPREAAPSPRTRALHRRGTRQLLGTPTHRLIHHPQGARERK
jgi:hypothetical protein